MKTAEKEKFKIKNVLKAMGPGFISGAADDDPTAIAAYTQAGAQFGYRQLWTTLFTFPFMTTVQEMSGRIGMVTGKGLAGVMKEHYSKKFLYVAVTILLVANIINIGADLGAMAAAGQMLLGIPFIFWLFGMTVFTLVMEIFISYRTYAKFLKYLALILVSYIIVAFVVKQDWSAIALSTFIPHVSFDSVFMLSLVAILGTNISPYLFFWQADEEVEEEILHHKIVSMGRGVPKTNQNDFKRLKIDTAIGMLFSNIIVFFICIAAASTLDIHNITDIQTPTQAAEALRPLAGDFAYILFAIGIIGSGLLAVPVLAGSASYAIAESFNWKEGLYRKLKKAHGFYGIIAIATFVGLLINFFSIQPFQLLVYAAALNAVLAPPLLIFILFIANNKKIMGQHTNSWISNTLGIFITILMFVASIALFLSLVK
jgi:NRAMP (natural resistance-associated macrophage protein)-like metal ion transporter